MSDFPAAAHAQTAIQATNTNLHGGQVSSAQITASVAVAHAVLAVAEELRELRLELAGRRQD